LGGQIASSKFPLERVGWKGTGKEDRTEISPGGPLALDAEMCCKKHVVSMVENPLK